MYSVLVFSFNAVAPILLLILVGYCARQMGLLDETALKQVNRFNFRFGFFSVMFINLCSMETVSAPPWGLTVFFLICLALLTGIGWLTARLLTEERARRPVLIMASFRSNYAIIGLVLAESLAGQHGAEMVTMFQLPVVLYFNIVSTVILSLYAGRDIDLRRLFRELRKNPLILGLLAGSLSLLARLPKDAAGVSIFSVARDLPWLYAALNYLNRMAVPLALIVLGGQMQRKESAAFRRELIGGVLLRLAIAPALGFGLAWAASRAGWIALDPAGYTVMISAFATPMAVASVVMSAEMDADDRLCGQIVLWTSILSLPAMFVITAVLRGLALI